jgi:hydrogenase expression/formation protein HypC
MCIGIPMRVVSATGARAWCEGRGQRLAVDTLLIGEPPPGTWVLAFNGIARRVLDGEEAAQTNAALDALEAALAGAASFDVFFADLVERERERARIETRGETNHEG